MKEIIDMLQNISAAPWVTQSTESLGVGKRSYDLASPHFRTARCGDCPMIKLQAQFSKERRISAVGVFREGRWVQERAGQCPWQPLVKDKKEVPPLQPLRNEALWQPQGKPDQSHPSFLLTHVNQGPTSSGTRELGISTSAEKKERHLWRCEIYQGTGPPTSLPTLLPTAPKMVPQSEVLPRTTCIRITWNVWLSWAHLCLISYSPVIFHPPPTPKW